MFSFVSALSLSLSISCVKVHTSRQDLPILCIHVNSSKLWHLRKLKDSEVNVHKKFNNHVFLHKIKHETSIRSLQKLGLPGKASRFSATAPQVEAGRAHRATLNWPGRLMSLMSLMILLWSLTSLMFYSVLFDYVKKCPFGLWFSIPLLIIVNSHKVYSQQASGLSLSLLPLFHQ